MLIRTSFLPLILLLSLISVKAQQPEVRQSTPEIPTVAFCDLLRNPEFYDGKEVRFRAILSSGFEVSALSDPACDGKEEFLTWVEFDKSVYTSSKPEVLEKFKKVFCCRYVDDPEWIMKKTELLVMAVFHKQNDEGYGHTNIFRFLVTIKRVEEVGVPEDVDLREE